MKLKSLNGILLSIILAGIILGGLMILGLLIWLAYQDSAPRNIVAVPEASRANNAQAEPLKLTIENTRNYTPHQFKIGPRIYMEQGQDGYNKGSLSSYGYSKAAKRNIGHVDITTLESRWYFPANDQNIIDIIDIITGKNEASEWHGILIEIVNSDTNADGFLSNKDKSQLLWVDESFQPKLVLENIDGAERISRYQTDILIRYEIGEDIMIGKFDIESGKIIQSSILKPQK